MIVSWAGVWLAGNWAGMYREWHQRYLDERDLLAPVLASDPAFADIIIVEETGPGAASFCPAA
jgi:hypothetical protein